MSEPTRTGGLVLRVLDGDGAEHILASSPDDSGRGLRAATPSVRRDADGAEVRQADIALDVLGLTLFGASDRADLPAATVDGPPGGAYRAELRRNGALVLDGLVPRAGVEHDPQLAQWGLPLVAAATEDMWNRLAAVNLTDLHGRPELGGYVMPLYVPDATGGLIERSDLQPSPWTPTVYSLYSVVRAVLATAGLALDGDLPPWTYLTGRPDHGDGTLAVRTATPYLLSRAGYDATHGPAPPTVGAGGVVTRDGSILLPRWSGADLLEAVSADAGWRVVAAYAPYPSAALTVRVLAAPSAPTSTDGMMRLDGTEARGGYTRGARAASAGTRGVRMAGAPVEASPVPRYPSQTRAPLPASRVATAPPPVLLSALSAWQWRREGQASGSSVPGAGDYRPDVDQVHVSAFSVASVVIDDVAFAPDAPALVGGLPYLEARLTGYPLLTDDALLVEIVTVAGAPVACAARVSTRGMVSPVSAGAVYSMRAGLDAAAETASGLWYLPAEGDVLVPGDPSASVALAGLGWLVEGVDLRLADGLARLDLARPDAADAVSAAPGGEPTVSDVRAVAYTTTRILNQTGQTQVTRRIVVSWTPPPVTRAVPVTYEVRRRYEDGEWSGWTTSYATSHIYTNAEPAGIYDIEVRPVALSGAPGAAVQVTLDPSA